jgi:hypothetical protein
MLLVSALRRLAVSLSKSASAPNFIIVDWPPDTNLHLIDEFMKCKRIPSHEKSSLLKNENLRGPQCPEADTDTGNADHDQGYIVSWHL